MRFDLFSSGRLRQALIDAGYPEEDLNPRTLSDWIKKDSPPAVLRLFTAEMLGMQKTAPSEEGAAAELLRLWSGNRPAAVPVILCFALPAIWLGSLCLLLAIPRIRAAR